MADFNFIKTKLELVSTLQQSLYFYFNKLVLAIESDIFFWLKI